MPVLTNIASGNSISFGEIASQASIALSNVGMLQLANAYSGVSNLGDIPICEFYSNGCPGVAPQTPTGMSATLSSGLTFNLSWNASSGATSYKVFRDGVLHKTVSTTSTTGSGVAYSTQYCWSVSAVNASGESAQSTQSCATTGAGAVYTEFEMSYNYYTTQINACNGSYVPDETTFRYHNGTGSYPNNGDIIYTTSSGGIFAGGSSWYWDIFGSTYQISNTGVVSNRSIC